MASAAKVVASTIPALVITPPVKLSPLKIPGLVPSFLASSRTLDIKKML